MGYVQKNKSVAVGSPGFKAVYAIGSYFLAN